MPVAAHARDVAEVPFDRLALHRFLGVIFVLRLKEGAALDGRAVERNRAIADLKERRVGLRGSDAHAMALGAFEEKLRRLKDGVGAAAALDLPGDPGAGVGLGEKFHAHLHGRRSRRFARRAGLRARSRSAGAGRRRDRRAAVDRPAASRRTLAPANGAAARTWSARGAWSAAIRRSSAARRRDRRVVRAAVDRGRGAAARTRLRKSA